LFLCPVRNMTSCFSV